MNKLSHTLAPEVKKIVQDGNDTYFVAELKKMSGKNWYREVKTISHDVGLNAKELIHKVANSLENALNGKEIKKDLADLKKYYQESFQEFEEEVFEKSEKVVDAMADYLEKAKDNIMAIMLEGPDAKQRLIAQHKSILDKSSPSESKEPIEKKIVKADILEQKEYTEEERTDVLITKITDILQAKLPDTEIIPAIKAAYLGIYKKTLFSKTLYKILGLSEKYIEILKSKKDISIPVVALAILIKKNPADNQAKVDLEREIDNIANPSYTPEGEQTLTTPGVKIIGTIDLSKIPTKKPKEEKKDEPELFMQAPTTDPLTMVGEKMSLCGFIGASKLSYNELRMHEMKNEPVAGRYRGYNPNPTKSGKIAHFFTVGFEDKGIHKNIPVNAFVEMEPSMKFDDDMIYKIRIVGIKKSNKISDRKQSMSVQGELVVDVPEAVGSGAPIGESLNPADLKKLQSRFNSN